MTENTENTPYHIDGVCHCPLIVFDGVNLHDVVHPFVLADYEQPPGTDAFAYHAVPEEVRSNIRDILTEERDDLAEKLIDSDGDLDALAAEWFEARNTGSVRPYVWGQVPGAIERYWEESGDYWSVREDVISDFELEDEDADDVLTDDDEDAIEAEIRLRTRVEWAEAQRRQLLQAGFEVGPVEVVER